MAKVRARALTLAALTLACTQPKSDVAPDDGGPVIQDPGPPSAVGASCEAREVVCGSALIEPETATYGAACCETGWVPGGSFRMGFAVEEVGELADLPIDDREHAARVSGFFLDRFEITFGRFLEFARQYTGPPPEGSGAHPSIAGSGWQAEWQSELPASSEGLLRLVTCDRTVDPTAIAAALEGPSAPPAAVLDHLDMPMSCLNWFAAFAFCAWDGGRLPTEAEWEYAAAGGAEDRAFPWGDDPALAVPLRDALPSAVGSDPRTRGRYGQDDLAGGVREWVLDWFNEEFYLDAGFGCRDCANLMPGIGRGLRGGADTTCCTGFESEFRSASRDLKAPGTKAIASGARCARDRAR